LNSYSNGFLVRLAYLAETVGPILVAVGVIVASQAMRKRLGGTSTNLIITGLIVIGASQFPSVMNLYSSLSDRLNFVGPTIGFVLLGVAALSAIPELMKR
jgi:hypothetical protein